MSSVGSAPRGSGPGDSGPGDSGPGDSADVQQTVARSADAADLHATAPALLLELQTGVGGLAAAATAGTERGRRPFRPDAEWEHRLADVAFGVYLLADQTGVQLDRAVLGLAESVRRGAEARAASVAPDDEWPGRGR